MKRLLFASAVVLGMAAPVLAQESVTFTIYDRVKKATTTVTGKVQSETPAGVTYKPAVGDVKTLQPNDIIDVTYELAGEPKALQARATSQENQLDKSPDKVAILKAVLPLYEEMRGKLDANQPAQRQVEFKIARLKARLAQEDTTQRDPAIATLTKFKGDHADSWQVTPATKLLAGLLMEKGDYETAQKVYEDLAKLPVPKELKDECELLSAQAMIKAGQAASNTAKFSEAEQKLQTVLRAVPEGDPQATKAKVLLAHCKSASGKLDEATKELDGIIAQVSDPDLKAMAYNTLGDCYLTDKKPNEAKWQYLWVDIVYNQNRAEHAKAVAQLAKVFEELKDEEKAKQYKDKLQTFK